MRKNNGQFTIKGITISKELLTKRFAQCNLSKCKHACCRHGAVIGRGSIARIKKLLPELFKLMRLEAVELVKKKGFHVKSVYKRSDLAEKRYHNTRIIKGGCVFLNFDDNGGCVLQRYSEINKINPSLKPFLCYFFPLDIIRKKLVVFKWKNLPCLDGRRNKQGPAIYESCSKELISYFGEESYKELNNHL